MSKTAFTYFKKITKKVQRNKFDQKKQFDYPPAHRSQKQRETLRQKNRSLPFGNHAAEFFAESNVPRGIFGINIEILFKPFRVQHFFHFFPADFLFKRFQCAVILHSVGKNFMTNRIKRTVFARIYDKRVTAFKRAARVCHNIRVDSRARFKGIIKVVSPMQIPRTSVQIKLHTENPVPLRRETHKTIRQIIDFFITASVRPSPLDVRKRLICLCGHNGRLYIAKPIKFIVAERFYALAVGQVFFQKRTRFRITFQNAFTNNSGCQKPILP